MGDMYPAWRRLRFGEVVRLNRDTSKAPEADGLKRYVGLEHIEPGDLRVQSWGDVAEGTTFTNRFRPGQVLFGKRRAYQRKLAVADFDGVCSGDIYVFEPKDPAVLLPELLPFVCQTDAFFDHAVGTSAGSLSPRTSWKKLESYEVPVPPLDEQRRIAALLRAALRSAEAAALLEAKAGALEAAAALAVFSSRAVDAAPRPALATICSRVGVGIASSVAHAYRATGVPIIRNTDIEANRLDLDDLRFIDPEFDRANRTKRVQAGDLVVTRTATDVPGVAAVVPPSLDSAQTFTTLICSPRPDVVAPEYLCRFINSPPGRHFIRSHKVGGLQQNLNASLIGMLPVPLLPLESQRDVVTRLQVVQEARQSASSRLEAARALLATAINRVLSDKEPA